MAMVVSGGTMPLHSNALPLSINTKTTVRSVSTAPLFSSALHSRSRSFSIIPFKLMPRVSRSLSVVSSVLSEDRATGVSGSGGTDAFKLTYLEVRALFTWIVFLEFFYNFNICNSISIYWYVFVNGFRETAGYGKQVDWKSWLIPFLWVIWILESHGSMMLPRDFWKASR